MRKSFYDLISVFLIGCLFAVVVLILSTATSIPEVQVSHSSNECVQVINYDEDDSYSCENMPTKYIKVWVK